MHVGQFVRFRHNIATADGGILNRERAIIVGFSPDGKVVRLVWSDGEPGNVPRERLRLTTGDNLTVGRTVGDRKKPVQDYGRRPVGHNDRPSGIRKPRPVCTSARRDGITTPLNCATSYNPREYRMGNRPMQPNFTQHELGKYDPSSYVPVTLPDWMKDEV